MTAKEDSQGDPGKGSFSRLFHVGQNLAKRLAPVFLEAKDFSTDMNLTSNGSKKV